MNILVLGVGNILYRDEAVGVKTVLELASEYNFPENVSFLDGGTLGFGLMNALMSYEMVIIVDAVKGGYEPGTLYKLEGNDLRKSRGFTDSMHQTDLVDTLIACELTGNRPQCVVFGIEPLDYTTLDTELSPIVAKNVPRLKEKVLEELTNLGIEYTVKKG